MCHDWVLFVFLRPCYTPDSSLACCLFSSGHPKGILGHMPYSLSRALLVPYSTGIYKVPTRSHELELHSDTAGDGGSQERELEVKWTKGARWASIGRWRKKTSSSSVAESSQHPRELD